MQKIFVFGFGLYYEQKTLIFVGKLKHILCVS